LLATCPLGARTCPETIMGVGVTPPFPPPFPPPPPQLIMLKRYSFDAKP